MHGEVSFLDHQFLVVNPFRQLAHLPDDSFVDNHFHRHGVFVSCPPLVIHMISVLKVVELALPMNVSRFCMGWTDLVWS